MSASFGDMLKAKGVDVSNPDTLPKISGKSKKRWGRATTEPVITWEDPALGTIRIVISGVKAGETQSENGNSCTPISFKGSVNDEVILTVRVRGEKNILVGHAIGKNFTDSTNRPELPAFRVKVGRKKDGTLHTFYRKQDGSNDFRISFTDLSRGAVVVVEISFVVRDGTYWICMQETFVGHYVWLKDEEALQFPADRVVQKEIGGTMKSATVLPADAIYAHQFANPFTVYQECRQLLTLAMEKGCVMPSLGEFERPIWAPTWPSMSQAPKLVMGVGGDWKPGVVQWFNLTLGYGMARTSEGVDAFVHFGQIRERDGTKPADFERLPKLDPMEPIFLKLEEGSVKPKAAVICATLE